MLNNLRTPMARLLDPIGRALARTGITANVITLVGTLGVVASAMICYPRGELYVGTLLITFFVLFDLLDGTVARVQSTASKWGAFLDSTLDRLSDAAILSGLLLWFVGEGRDDLLAGVTLFCLVAGFGVSYIKARAEGLGANCDVGVAERPERLILVLVAVGLHSMGVPYVLTGGLWMLALLSAVTVAHRLLETYNRLTAADRSTMNP